ncbi:hypothetical protein, partial [Desulfonauticus submarinus]
ITLVNSVNTNDSDLLLFFKKLEEIALGNIEQSLFEETKEELISDFRNHKKYVFGDEELSFDLYLIENITLKDVFENVFNAENHGKIEILEGEKGKEIVLKLETSDRPFALIKIGDAKKFQRERLGNNYMLVSSFENKKYFENLNQNEDINLLLGSRSFYEGWDSNRPNVINMINIGKKDAKKFVLQGIGRGIRIEPHKGERKRLPANDPNKNPLLETLFVFATDKRAVKAIIETVEEQQNKEEVTISLFENTQKPFDLLIPVYKEQETRKNIARFNISQESLERFKNYLGAINKNTLLLKTGMPPQTVNLLFEKINSNDFFQIKKENIYYDMELLLNRIISHINLKNKIVSGIKELEDEIIHFKHIKVINFSDEEIKSFREKIESVKNYQEKELTEEEKKAIEILKKSGQVIIQETKNEETFKDLKIKKIAEHYYLPLIYSEKEKVEYIKHIINVESEVRFIKNLEEFVKENRIDVEWMFSKIDESLDKFYIPYFYKRENVYRKFYPDFIFWIKKGNDYKIVFVDPKGTSNADYQNKVDEFEKLFLDTDGKHKIFKYKNFEIIFDLKLIAKDVNTVGDKYANYWLGENDFSFLEI